MSWHRHQWRETERIVAKQGMVTLKAGGLSNHTIERLAMGVTSIVLTCQECGDKKTVEVLGDGSSDKPFLKVAS